MRNFVAQLAARGTAGRGRSRATSTGACRSRSRPGFDDKRIYVWFEAVIGYFSASLEWAERQRRAGRLASAGGMSRRRGARPRLLLHRQGQHPLPHHHLAGDADGRTAGCDLPYDVPANEFLNLEGQKMSTSRELGRLAAGLPGALRPRPAALLPDGQRAGDARRRVLLGELLAPQQRRAGRYLGQPRQSRADLRRAGISRAASRNRRRSATPTGRCSMSCTAPSSGSAS